MCQNNRGNPTTSCKFWASGVDLLTVLIRTLDIRGKCNVTMMSHFNQLIKNKSILLFGMGKPIDF